MKLSLLTFISAILISTGLFAGPKCDAAHKFYADNKEKIDEALAKEVTKPIVKVVQNALQAHVNQLLGVHKNNVPLTSELLCGKIEKDIRELLTEINE